MKQMLGLVFMTNSEEGEGALALVMSAVIFVGMLALALLGMLLHRGG